MDSKNDYKNLTKTTMEMKASDLLKVLASPKDLSRFIAGALARDMADRSLMLGRVVEAARKHQLLKQLGNEIKSLIDSGKAREDCLESTISQEALLDLLQLVDREVPNECKFNAVKNIFLYSLKNSDQENEKILAYELQKLCSRLSSGEIMVLKAVYELHKGINLRPYSSPSGINLSTHHASEWLNYVAFQAGYNDSALVELHEGNLIELKLISGRMHADNSGVSNRDFRLTSLGIKMCSLIISKST